MNTRHFETYRQWFDCYVRDFLGGSGADDNNIQLKIDHTLRVCDEITALGRSLDLGGEDLVLARTCALLHDIGRFEQYRRYGTYADHESEDHAQLGVTILKQRNILADLPGRERALIIQVISCHNRARLPEHLDEQSLLFARLLRDADKLDIWRVVVNYYLEREERPNATIELNLPDTPGVSPAVVDDLRAGRFVNREHIRNLNDFKLLQVGWIYDVNFPETYRLVKERNYLNLILDRITAGSGLKEPRSMIGDFLNEKTKTQ